MGKWIVEFEAKELDGTEAAKKGFIGKIDRGNRGQGTFEVLAALWNAGFRPPSPYTVVRPLAYVPDRRLLLQEKAPGRLAREIVFADSGAACDVLGRVAGWLVALQSCTVVPPSRVEQAKEAVVLHGRELRQSLPQHDNRIRCLVERALSEFDPSRLTALAPSHGDFHLENVFVEESGRVTAIDLDKFGLGERAADVAYLLAQTAIMGYRRHGNFLATARIRDHFLQAYLKEADSLSYSRLSVYLGMAFLQSLFYELCILKTGDFALIEPWLNNAERCLLHGEVTLGEHTRPKALMNAGQVSDCGLNI